MKKPIRRKLIYFQSGNLEDLTKYKRRKLSDDKESCYVKISPEESSLHSVRINILVRTYCFRCFQQTYLN